MPAEDIPALISLAYEAIGAPAGWRKFLSRLCEATNADSAMFAIAYPSRHDADFTCVHGIPAETVQEWVEKWMDKDPWTFDAGNAERIKHLPVGVPVPSSEMCPDEVLEQLEVYKEFLQKHNKHYCVGMVVVKHPDQLSVLGTHRAKAKGPAREEELEVWRAIFPSLRQAVILSAEFEGLRRELDALSDTADDQRRAVFLVDVRGTITRANAAGERLLQAATAARRQEGRLRFASGAVHSRFQEAMQLICAAGRPEGDRKSVTFGFRDEKGSNILVAVKAIGHDGPTFSAQPCAAVHVIDPGAVHEIDSERLVASLGLTRAEARLAAALARGLSLQEAAEGAFVSMNTIRTHLRRALEKTGCHRQAELVALVLRAQ